MIILAIAIIATVIVAIVALIVIRNANVKQGQLNYFAPIRSNEQSIEYGQSGAHGEGGISGTRGEG